MMPSASGWAGIWTMMALDLRSKMTIALSPPPSLMKPADLGNEGDAVGDLLAWEIGKNLTGGGVDDHGVGAARDVEPMSLGIDGEIVPAAFAADGEALSDGPIGLGGSGNDGNRK